MVAGRTATDDGMRSTELTVGLLFSDIEGSTRLLQRLGAAYAGVLHDHRRLLRTAFSRYGGEERGTEGDSFFVTFRHASDAVSAALAAQRALVAHPWPAEVSVRVRMGVHVGEVREIAGSVIGLSIHEAARIGATGHGGQVVVSSEVVTRAGPLPDGARWLDLGSHELADIAAPMKLFQLVHSDLPSHFPPLRTHAASRNNLPAQAGAFIGRERERREVLDLVTSSRLVTLTGAGGAGKSRLALRVAADQEESFPDGRWFVDLAPVSDPTAVAQQIADALGLPDTAAADVAGAIRRRQLLLLIDNCEHLIEAVSRVVDDVLTRCPGVTVLTTSREPLGLNGEVAWRVPSLTDADAVALFCARARAVNPRFELTENNGSALRDIISRLDAIPLALELAAARLGSLTVEQVAERLDQRFRLLTGGARGAMARQRTLQATVDWSYDLLEADAQTLLRGLGVFVGGFSLEAAEFVSAAQGFDRLDVLDHIDQLVAKSLVVADEHDGHVRYRLLETIRQYVLDRQVQNGDIRELRQAHLEWVLHLVQAAESTLWFGGNDVLDQLTRLDVEHANIRAGFDWAVENGELPAAVDVLLTLLVWFLARGRSREGLEWCRALQATEGSEEDRALASFAEFMLAGNAGGRRDDLVARVRHDGAALSRSTRPWLSPVLTSYLAALSSTDDPAAAVAACQAGVAEARGANSTALAMALQALCWVLSDAGDLTASQAAGEEALRLSHDIGLSFAESRMSYGLAQLALQMNDLDAAWQRAENAIAAARRTDDIGLVLAGTLVLGHVLAARGDAAAARDILLSIVDRAAESQSDAKRAELHENVALYAVLAGDGDSARVHAAAALRLLPLDAPQRAGLLVAAAEAARLQGDLAGARQALDEGIDHVSRRGLDDPAVLASLLEAMASLRRELGDAGGAARLLGAARSHRTAGPPAFDLHARQIAAQAARLRDQLGVGGFEQATAEGEALDVESVLRTVWSAPLTGPISD